MSLQNKLFHRPYIGVEDVVARINGVVGGSAKLHSPLLGEEETRAVSECVRGGNVTHGPQLEKFENDLALRLRAKNVVAVSSGTAALHLALLVAGVGRGDSVAMPAFTFVATANAVKYCGAVPNFIDCDEYGGLSPEKLDSWLKTHKVKAVVCVHAFGHPCDMTGLLEVCNRYSVPLIEDAAQALGSWHGSTHAGTFGLLGTFSFNGNKIITTGGGGCVVTSEKKLAERVRSLASTSKIDVPHEFWHAEVGFNYRMPNINAALGLAQVSRLYDILSRKRALAKKYQEAFSDCIYAGMMGAKHTGNNWLNAVVLHESVPKEARYDIVNILSSKGIECRLSWTPLNLLSMYKDSPRDDLSMTFNLASRIINVPSGPGLTP